MQTLKFGIAEDNAGEQCQAIVQESDKTAFFINTLCPTSILQENQLTRAQVKMFMLECFLEQKVAAIRTSEMQEISKTLKDLDIRRLERSKK